MIDNYIQVKKIRIKFKAMNRKKSDNKPIQRSRLTLKEKYDLIRDHKNKMDIEKLKEKYKCGKTAVVLLTVNLKSH